MGTYTIFASDGTQARKVSKPKADGPPAIDNGETMFEGSYSDDMVLIDGEIINKPESSIVLVNSEATAETGTIKLVNVPNPTEVVITGNHTTFRETIEDGGLEFSLDVAGEYTVKCESKLELPVEFKVVIL